LSMTYTPSRSRFGPKWSHNLLLTSIHHVGASYKLQFGQSVSLTLVPDLHVDVECRAGFGVAHKRLSVAHVDARLLEPGCM
jgi:hypothetical protein